MTAPQQTNPAFPGEREKFLRALVIFALLLLAAALGFHKERSADLPWHLKTGEWILAHRAVPRTDFFSFTRAGAEWIDAQWLFQIAAQGLFQFAGEEALTLMVMVVSAAVFALLFFSVGKSKSFGLSSFFGLVFLLAIRFRLQCRPELFSYFYMAAMLFSLERGRAGQRGFYYAVPLLQLLWVNSQGIWPAGLALQAAFVADRAWERRQNGESSFRRLLPGPEMMMVGVSIFTAGLQPYGLGGVLFPLLLLREVTLESTLHKQVIIEFQSMFSSHFQAAEDLPFLLLAAAALLAALRCGRRLRLFSLLLGLGFVYLAINAVRNVGIASVVLYYLLRVHLAGGREMRSSLGQTVERRGALFAGLAAGVMVVATLMQPVRRWDGSRFERGLGLSRRAYPVEAAEFLHSIRYKGRVITDGPVGNYLIWSGWPRWEVSADTRMEVGGEEGLRRMLLLTSDVRAFREAAEEGGVEAAAFYHLLPGARAFALQLAQQPEWALVHVDRTTVVFLRRTLRWKGVIAEKEITLAELAERFQKRQRRGGKEERAIPAETEERGREE